MEGSHRQPAVAGFGYRVAAVLFDLGLALAALAGALMARLSQATALLLALLAWIFVTSVASAVFDGQTLGKRLTGTRVITARGAPAGLGTSLLRDTAARALWVIPVFFLIDSIHAITDARGRTLRDRMARTYVVRETRSPARAAGVAAAAAALLAIWIVGTGTVSDEPGEGYSAADRSAFMDGCAREGSSRGRCACLYDYISARLSHDEFAGVHTGDPDRWPAHVRRVAGDAAATCDGGQPEPADPATETASSRPRNLATS